MQRVLRPHIERLRGIVLLLLGFLGVRLGLLLLLPGTGHAGVQFDGVDDYISLGTSSVYQLANQSFSVTMFLQSSNVGTGYLISKRDEGSDVGGYFIRVDGSGTVTARLITSTGAVAAQRTSVATVTGGALHHIGVVFQTDTTTLANNHVSIYIDGALSQGSETQTGPGAYALTSTPVQLGITTGLPGAGWFVGNLHELTIYAGALSAENMVRLSNSQTKYSSLTVPRLGYWPLDDCGQGLSGEAVTFTNRGGTLTNGTGVDGGNNTGLVCLGSPYMSYPWGPN